MKKNFQVPIPSMGRTVYFPTNFTIKINHSWIGKYTNPMDGMGTLKRPPLQKFQRFLSPKWASPRGLRLFKYHSIGHSHFTCCGLLCLWCFCFNFRAFGGTKRSPMEVFGGWVETHPHPHPKKNTKDFWLEFFVFFAAPKNPFVCRKKGSTPNHSYAEDGIGTLNHLLGRDLDP